MIFCKSTAAAIKSQLQEILYLRDKFSEKSDGSYVSDGDLLVQAIVTECKAKYIPSYELISEEKAPFINTIWNDAGSYVILDPIDGTENFVSGLREWGVGISIYTKGVHSESCIYLPELDEMLISGMPLKKYKSRIYGVSSSLTRDDMSELPQRGFEFRIFGCSMYNCLAAIRGSLACFENIKGVNCWDVLPGLNLALEHGCRVEVDGRLYLGEMLFPTRKYKIKIENTGC